jgi:hypothetical protein
VPYRQRSSIGCDRVYHTAGTNCRLIDTDHRLAHRSAPSKLRAAVDTDGVAGDPPGVVGREEGNHAGCPQAGRGVSAPVCRAHIRGPHPFWSSSTCQFGRCLAQRRSRKCRERRARRRNAAPTCRLRPLSRNKPTRRRRRPGAPSDESKTTELPSCRIGRSC